MMSLISNPALAAGVHSPATLAVDASATVTRVLNPVLLQASPLDALKTDMASTLFSLGQAIVILVVGWLIAVIASAVIRGILNRTDIDNRLAASISGGRSEQSAFPIEQWVAGAVFWIVMVFVIVAFLRALNLPEVSEPLQGFLDQIFAYLPRVGAAGLWIFIAWVVANLVRMIVTRSADTFKIDEKLQQSVGDEPTATASATDDGEKPLLVSDTLGNALYWFILLFFLPIVLETLGLQEQLVPLQNLLNDIMLALPRVLKAVLIGVAGWFIARVVRGIITNLLAAAGSDRLGEQFGLSSESGSRRLSWLAGTAAYVLILIPTAVAALDSLEISAISDPAISMLNQVMDFLPQLAVAGIVLAVAYYIGRFVANLVTQLLTSIGFNNLFVWLGLESLAPVPADAEAEGETSPQKTPSEFVGIVVLVGIMLFALVTATDILELDALTEIVNGLIEIAGPVLVALVILALGLYLANLAFRLITASGSRQSNILGNAARISIITLTTAMALDRMGIAPDIINLAFGLLVGAIAVAIALAFGLGGRDVAADQLREWLNSFKGE